MLIPLPFKNSLFPLSLLTLIFTLSACYNTTQRLTLSEDSNFSRRSGLIIDGLSDDRSGFLQELSYKLSVKKFRVISDRVNREKYTIDEHTEFEEDSVSRRTEFYNEESIEGQFLLETNFDVRTNTIGGPFVSNFRAVMFNSDTGEIIMSAKIDEAKSFEEMTTTFVQLLMRKMYELQ